MGSEIDQFEYTALNYRLKEIRLLTLSRRSQHIPFEDPLMCSIDIVSLRDSSAPLYDTASYTWGESRDFSKIYINGKARMVPASAEKALKCIRLHTGTRDRVIWIDAICIDQNDFDERSQQVRIMGDIYKRSVSNLIYLGEDDGTFGRACLDFRHILKEIEIETNGFRTFLTTVFDHEGDKWHHTEDELMVKIDPTALINFYSRPWFQ